MESSASIDVDPVRFRSVLPEHSRCREDGLNIRWPDPPQAQEARLSTHKIYAALAYARANRLNRVVIDSPRRGSASSTAGKVLSRRASGARRTSASMTPTPRTIGIRALKVGMTLAARRREDARDSRNGLEEILVVEEKRQLIEYQLKEELYNWRDDVRPRVIGKYADEGEWEGVASRATGNCRRRCELTPALIARVIVERIASVSIATTPRNRA